MNSNGIKQESTPGNGRSQKMLQNKKAARFRAACKWFVCGTRPAKKVTEWLDCNLPQLRESGHQRGLAGFARLPICDVGIDHGVADVLVPSPLLNCVNVRVLFRHD